jgi:hypothetical protein
VRPWRGRAPAPAGPCLARARRPGRARAPAQEALLLVLDRAAGDELPGGGVKPPSQASARLLVFKHEIGSVLGLRGATVKEIRQATGAAVKIDDNAGEAGVVVALPDDQLVKARPAPLGA